MSQTNSLDLLLKEIKDPHAQENWYRLKLWLDRLETGITTIIQGGGGSVADEAVWEKFNRSVPASTTYIADSLALSSFNSLEYIINYKHSVTSKEKSLKMTVVKDDTVLNDSVYAKVGAPLSVGINAVINGSDLELKVTNSETSIIEMSVARLILP